MMKRTLLIVLLVVAAFSFAFGQMKMANDAKTQAQIIKLETAGWEAWKNKDSAWTRDNVTEEFLLVNSEGVSSKAQVIKATATDCEVKSYSLANFKFVTLDKDSVLMTYTAKQDGVCNGKTIPANVRASVVYVKRGAKWLEALYMETPTGQ
jgi:hypothetical protein